ncbi:hypothetical protein [uncultured Amphritea sp.]|uniref:hypothetical protein n=1 Tax=uncultured Amphritea sp. TaxID=981605 RepID=UPI0026315BCA|nr:hypothetical protein [uncultured Amphritea sp.]
MARKSKTAALEVMLQDTGGAKSLKWYAVQSGLSEKTVSSVKAKLGLTRRRTQKNVAKMPIVKSMLIDGFQAMTVSEVVDPLERLKRVMGMLSKKYPDSTQYQLLVVRNQISSKLGVDKNNYVDAHSGYIYALRLPMNRIAEVLQ